MATIEVKVICKATIYMKLLVLFGWMRFVKGIEWIWHKPLLKVNAGGKWSNISAQDSCGDFTNFINA